jgi:hypothetical protein
MIIGYIPQRALPLYVRSTLEEKEGTSLYGDPSQEELAEDRRYSHHLGRPLVRFNPNVAMAQLQHSQVTSDEQHSTEQGAVDPFDLSTLSLVSSSSLDKVDRREKRNEVGLATKELLQEKEKEEVSHLPITSSLVRMVFNNPEPSLRDLKYLDETF